MIGDRAADVKVTLLVRADSAGATHGFVRAILEANADYTIGYIIDGRVRDMTLCSSFRKNTGTNQSRTTAKCGPVPT